MTPSAAPQIFDRALGRARMRRALALGYESFLLERIAGDALDRLSAVTRRFSRALDLGTPTESFARALAASKQADQFTRAASNVERASASVVANEDMLPFAPGAFDLAISLLSLHSVNDLPGALIQIRMALKADGLFIAALLGGSTLTELRQSLIAAETELLGGASPRIAPFADVRDMGALLQRAGFALPVTDVDRVIARYQTPFDLMRDLRRMGMTNILSERSRKPLRRGVLLRAAEIYGERFADADGRLRATFDIVWLSGWVPHESQQKPLKPGSAKARLADALKSSELSAGEKAAR